jgi:PIN domain nuclease of toxin-antitoxin system
MIRRPLLLDTCAAIWVVSNEIPLPAATALTESYNEGLLTYVSPITALEVGTLARKGRFRSNLSPRRWFEQLMTLPGAALAPMPPELLIESSLLPDFHDGDPADRIIAATAREYGFTVMTRDQALLDYGKQGHLSVLAC